MILEADRPVNCLVADVPLRSDAMTICHAGYGWAQNNNSREIGIHIVTAA